jgi:folate-binding protein YgfZ
MSASKSSTFDRDYRALRTGPAFVHLDGWSSISITGEDRQLFLHNFCTNDVKRLLPGESCEAFFTDVKGRIIGHGAVSCCDGELVFFGAPGQAQRLAEHLDRYVIREDVQVRDTTTERGFLLVLGGQSSGETSQNSIAWNLVNNEAAKIVQFSQREGPPTSSILSNGGIVVVGTEAFTAARIEAGAPLYGVDFDEHNFPQEVGRDREAISFTKGCYLGQETVARIDALGHVNQRIVGVAFSGDIVPPPGTELTQNGSKVGHVTSATMSPRLNRPLALAMVRREANSIGTLLESPVGPAEVIELPISGSAGN